MISDLGDVDLDLLSPKEAEFIQDMVATMEETNNATNRLSGPQCDYIAALWERFVNARR